MPGYALPLAPLGNIQKTWSLGQGRIEHARFLPDGSGLVYWQVRSGSPPGGWHSLGFLDLDHEETRFLESREGPFCLPSCLALSTDGYLVLTAGYNEDEGWFRIGPLMKRTHDVGMERNGFFWIHSGVIHPDGMHFFLGTDLLIEDWHLRHSRVQAWPLFMPEWLEPPDLAGASWQDRLGGKCLQMAISGDGEWLFWSFEARLQDMPDLQAHGQTWAGSALLRLEADPDRALPPCLLKDIPPATVARFTRSSRYLLTGHFDGTVRAWDLRDNKPCGLFPVGYPVESLALSGGPCRFAAGCRDGSVSVWNAKKDRPLWISREYFGSVLDLLFHPRTGDLYSAHAEGTVVQWSGP